MFEGSKKSTKKDKLKKNKGKVSEKQAGKIREDRTLEIAEDIEIEERTPSSSYDISLNSEGL
jgi:hypothetical protein